MDDPIITMATPAIDWLNAWDYNALAQITDGLFIMGYNYFYSGSSFSGPVSPLGEYFYDLEYTVNDYLYKTDNQSDKIILGLPYYGYDWPVINSNINAETTDDGIAKTYSSIQATLSQYDSHWHENSNSSWISYENNNWRQCWYDDSLSLSNKYQFAKDNNLSGVGIWALGYDNGNNELWDALENQFTIEISGDLNSDNVINILDVMIIINMILENIEYSSNADLNQDQIINVIDVITLINIILG
jgi:spore germination protein YaaH